LKKRSWAKSKVKGAFMIPLKSGIGRDRRKHYETALFPMIYSPFHGNPVDGGAAARIVSDKVAKRLGGGPMGIAADVI
jgi:hypothetical protein